MVAGYGDKKEFTPDIQDIARHTPANLWFAGPDGTLELASDACAEFIGSTVAALLESGWEPFLHPEDREGFREAFSIALSMQQPLEIVARLRRADGAWRRMKIEGNPVFSENDEFLGITGTCNAVTGLISGEKKNYWDYPLFRRLFHEIPVMLIAWDSKLRRFDLNKYAQEVLGWSSEDAAGASFLEKVYPDPDYRDRAVTYMQSMKPGWHEFQVTARDGTVIPADWANIRLNDEIMLGIGIDLRKRRKAEQELEQYRLRLEEMVRERTRELRHKMEELAEARHNIDLVINTVPEGVMVIDQEKRILYANPAAENLFGKPVEELVGTIFAYPLEGDSLEIDRPSGDNGQKIVLGVRSAEIHWRDTPCTLVTLRDITWRKQESERVRVLSKRLVRAQEKERRDIGHELHDEIGGALTAIKLEMGRIRKKLGRDAVAECKVVGDMLSETMSLVSNLSQKMRPDILNEYGLEEALKWHFERYTARNGVRVLFNSNLPAERFPENIEMTAYRIIQEALTNVARYAGVDEASVTVVYEPEKITIRVEDNGCGFDARSVEIASSGISGMQDRAYLAGGELYVDSSPGRGTCVTCELPLTPDQMV
jgi:PAS domain S-box-containing protein